MSHRFVVEPDAWRAGGYLQMRLLAVLLSVLTAGCGKTADPIAPQKTTSVAATGEEQETPREMKETVVNSIGMKFR